MESFRSKLGNRDIEAADFDENELDDLHGRPTLNGAVSSVDAERYSSGSDRDDGTAGNGTDKGKGRSELSG